MSTIITDLKDCWKTPNYIIEELQRDFGKKFHDLAGIHVLADNCKIQPQVNIFSDEVYDIE